MSTSATARPMPTQAFKSISLQQTQTQQCARMHTPTNHQRVQGGGTLQANQRREQIAIRDLMRKRAQSLTRETVFLRVRTQRIHTYVEILEETKHCQRG